ncbi:arsenical-resistance protein [Beggiatoa alba B18LD]|uniref:Arsenical-resistance protein n=1 Tax=Beggiatoa alba B18LD TaxID=395493 RepID=I3CCX2_9GAMM|nr:ACR3 family arsenite efflux transporter [Beggiatoa alba]EIJ41465.1 arsenical-resistance protein [Beggiatoa alba B18LD]
MSAQCEIVVKQASGDPLGFFGRYLTLWIALCIGAGILLGNVFPALFTLISQVEVSHINLVVAVLIWGMIYPMMVSVDFSALKHIGERPKGLIITSVTNWLIKPFTMALLGMLFFNLLFKQWVNPEDAKAYIAGMILLGSAPCTAMVFVWSQLTRGDATYTLVQVSLNDLIMVFAYAPIVAFLLGISDVIVPWETLLLSVVLYIVIPLVAGYLTRVQLLKQHNGNEQAVNQFTEHLKPLTIIGLLLTVILLFGFQGQTILEKPLIILLIAIPLTIQSLGVAGIAYYWAWWWRVPLTITAPVALIGSSNFFELAVAVAISLFGLQSGAALATVVGVLVEVPVMLFIVYLVNKNAATYARSIAQ